MLKVEIFNENIHYYPVDERINDVKDSNLNHVKINK
ncbi:Uncharacterised protein [Sphingobacterium spiritivorum]|uniref:Uncharacterized protein n=1 Tax=Sphingobacterium spiritivorum TaxID=258 RepID=A0A380CT03_SPHSI|nr:Uncharacterised protein [Sphingobacterium spiritivorum]